MYLPRGKRPLAREARTGQEQLSAASDVAWKLFVQLLTLAEIILFSS